MRHILRTFALAGAAIAVASAARCDVKVKRIDYHGWPGAYQLSNGTVELVFVPQIGRVMRYGRVGGPNLLWEKKELRGKTFHPTTAKKEWTNFGGDKVWPAPQAHWTWPPDPFLDGSLHQVEVLPGNRLKVTSQKSMAKSIRIVRDIALDPTGTGVTFRNTMENVGDQDVDWSVWEVTQVVVPERAELASHKGGHFPAGIYIFKDYAPKTRVLENDGKVIRFRWNETKNGKIGSDSPAGWARAVIGGELFTVSAKLESGLDYPDDGCAQEIWSNPAPDRYMELELLGPIRKLQPGDAQTLVTHWKLSRAVR